MLYNLKILSRVLGFCLFAVHTNPHQSYFKFIFLSSLVTIFVLVY